MKAQNNINLKRVLLGGITAAAVIFVATGIINGAILGSDFQSWSQEMGSLLHPTAQSTSMMIWVLMSLIYGVAGVWIYALARSGYGAGPKTALLAGLVLWLVSKGATALDLLTLGVLPEKLIAGQVVGSFIEILLGILVGAWLYRE